MSRRKGPRGLSPEDQALWDRIAARTTPMHPERKAAAPARPPPPAAPPAAPPSPPIGPFRLGERAAADDPEHELARPLAAALGDLPVRMDPKSHKKMVRGKLKPEARIDLHGMTLAAAQPALTRFISEAHARGLRLVLVITGKGRPDSGEGPIPVRTGVLKHQVPHWLTAGALRPVVLQVTEAHQRHGGAGAYYVYLRRTR